jgi:hypothetical protein
MEAADVGLMLVEAREVGVGDVELLVGCVQIVRYVGQDGMTRYRFWHS